MLWAAVPRGGGVYVCMCGVCVCMGIQLYRAARSAARENVRCWCEICTKFAVVSPRNQKRKLLTGDRLEAGGSWPLAVAEAFVSITSGVLIWMGFWDFIDTYVVPERWWAKLLMIVFGAIGLFCTRTLYDKEMLHAIRASTGLGERPDAGLLPLHTDSAAPTRRPLAEARGAGVSSGPGGPGDRPGYRGQTTRRRPRGFLR